MNDFQEKSHSTFEDVLDNWRLAGRKLLTQHGAELDELIDGIDQLILAGRYSAAAAQAQIAANHAVMWHPGLFTCRRFEGTLRRLGRQALPSAGGRRLGPPEGPLNVLHVVSRVGPFRGGTRLVWRWIVQDSESRHSVILTRQVEPVPARLVAAVSSSGGQATRLNQTPGSLLNWAKTLQEMFRQADIVILHSDNYDIIPFLALAGMECRPPIALVNHSDHVLWIGASFADLVVSSRRSGMELCIKRRGLEPKRNILLPLCLEPLPRVNTSQIAKKRLGIPPDSLVMLSIARATKYRPIGNLSFADSLVPVLRRDKRLLLLAVGPGGAVDWTRAMAEVPGQIRMLPESPDTKLFYEAADIYLDSFPFTSITSLFEAGLHGLPLVTLFPFGHGCEVIGANSPGIDRVLLRAEDVPTYQSILSALAGSAELRKEFGSKAKESIERTNMGDEWKLALRKVYERAFEVSSSEPRLSEVAAPQFTDLDLFSPFVFGDLGHGRTRSERLAGATEADLRIFPVVRRLPIWMGMAWRREFVYRSRATSWRYLIPEWVTSRRWSHQQVWDKP